LIHRLSLTSELVNCFSKRIKYVQVWWMMHNLSL